jgi:outer membrane protein TolC
MKQEIGGFMFTSSRPLRTFFSGAYAALLLASIVAAQDKPSGAPGPSDATALPIQHLPDDFSWIGVIATWTIFDFFKRERTIKERGAQVTMARANLEMVRAKVAAAAQKTVVDLDRTRRILELTRQVASLRRAATPRDQDPGAEAKAALAKAEAEMFQAELDYRTACAQMKRAAGEQ